MFQSAWLFASDSRVSPAVLKTFISEGPWRLRRGSDRTCAVSRRRFSRMVVFVRRPPAAGRQRCWCPPGPTASFASGPRSAARCCRRSTRRRTTGGQRVARHVRGRHGSPALSPMCRSAMKASESISATTAPLVQQLRAHHVNCHTVDADACFKGKRVRAGVGASLRTRSAAIGIPCRASASCRRASSSRCTRVQRCCTLPADDTGFHDAARVLYVHNRTELRDIGMHS